MTRSAGTRGSQIGIVILEGESFLEWRAGSNNVDSQVRCEVELARQDEARGQKKRSKKLKSKVNTDTRKGRVDDRTSPVRIETKEHAPRIDGA